MASTPQIRKEWHNMTEKNIIYNTIIIGAGASGLFCSAAMEKGNQQLVCEDGKRFAPGNKRSISGESFFSGKRLILEKTGQAGTKLLMSGNGQCNITHDGSIKEFPACYGKNGNKIRSCLYKHNNLSLISFLECNGVPTQTRKDGKVFPASMDAHDVLDLLMRKTKENGFEINYNSSVTKIERLSDAKAPYSGGKASFHTDAPHGAGVPGVPLWRITTRSLTDKTDSKTGKANDRPNKPGEKISKTSKKTYLTRNLVIASGGCSYPSTGSDGSMFHVLQKNLSIQVSKLRPALSSIQVTDYPYGELAGISFENAQVTILPQREKNAGGNMAGCIKDTDRNIKPCAEPGGDYMTFCIKPNDNACGLPARKQKKKAEKRSSARGEALLFTHKDLSGPAILNLSKYAAQGDVLKINYLYPLQYQQAAERLKAAFHATKANAANVIAAEFDLPKRFCQLLSGRTGSSIKNLAKNLTGEEFSIASVSGFRKAMATSGGIALSQINTATMECKEHPGLFAIGEALDVDGITGGYNLQFAYSSAKTAACAILQANASTSL